MTKRFLGRLQVTASNGSPGLLFAMRTILEVTKLITHSPPGNFNSEQLMPNFERPGVFRSSDDWWKSVNHITIRVSCCTVWGKVKLICDEDEHSSSRGSLKLFCVLEPFSTLWKSFFLLPAYFFFISHLAKRTERALFLILSSCGSSQKAPFQNVRDMDERKTKQKAENRKQMSTNSSSSPSPVPFLCQYLWNVMRFRENRLVWPKPLFYDSNCDSSRERKGAPKKGIFFFRLQTGPSII